MGVTQLRVPDRVPVQLFLSYFPTRYTGIPSDAACCDAEKWQSANRQTILDFAPDSYWVQSALVSGLALEILGAQQIKWPGYGLPPNRGHQMIELEPMKGDEYDAFLADPSDFIVRTYLPRVWSAMVPLAELPSLRTLIGGTALASFVANLATPELAAARWPIWPGPGRSPPRRWKRWQWTESRRSSSRRRPPATRETSAYSSRFIGGRTASCRCGSSRPSTGPRSRRSCWPSWRWAGHPAPSSRAYGTLASNTFSISPRVRCSATLPRRTWRRRRRSWAATSASCGTYRRHCCRRAPSEKSRSTARTPSTSAARTAASS